MKNKKEILEVLIVVRYHLEVLVINFVCCIFNHIDYVSDSILCMIILYILVIKVVDLDFRLGRKCFLGSW